MLFDIPTIFMLVVFLIIAWTLVIYYINKSSMGFGFWHVILGTMFTLICLFLSKAVSKLMYFLTSVGVN